MLETLDIFLLSDGVYGAVISTHRGHTVGTIEYPRERSLKQGLRAAFPFGKCCYSQWSLPTGWVVLMSTCRQTELTLANFTLGAVSDRRRVVNKSSRPYVNHFVLEVRSETGRSGFAGCTPEAAVHHWTGV